MYDTNEIKRPRQFARDILAMPDRDDRRAALERVPKIYRDLVRKHVEIAYNQKRFLNRHGRAKP